MAQSAPEERIRKHLTFEVTLLGKPVAGRTLQQPVGQAPISMQQRRSLRVLRINQVKSLSGESILQDGHEGHRFLQLRVHECKPAEVIMRKHRPAEQLIAACKSVPNICRVIQVPQPTDQRWSQQYSAMQVKKVNWLTLLEAGDRLALAEGFC